MKKFLLLLTLLSVAFGQQVVHTIDAPADGITGLAMHPSGQRNDELWAVSKTEEKVYKLNPVTGEIISSFSCVMDTNEFTTGLAYAGDVIYVAQWDSTINGGWGNEYSTTGEYIGRTSLFC
jgi:hypothetical protein